MSHAAPLLRVAFALALAVVSSSGCQASPTAPSATTGPVALRVTMSIAPALLVSQGERGCANAGDVLAVWRYTVTLRNDDLEPARLAALVRLKDATPYGGTRDVERLDAAGLTAAFGTDTIAPGGEVTAAQCIAGWGAADLTYTLADARGRVATSPVTLMHQGFIVDVFPRR